MTAPQVPQTSAVYVLTNPEGVRAVFGDSTDADYVGTLSGDDGITGLDSPEVRENFSTLVEADGASHGPFFFGRRPITITATVIGTSIADRNTKLEKVKRATNCMRADGTLSWTLSGGSGQFVSFRRQQPTRIGGIGWAKTVFCGLVCADPRVYSNALHTATILHNTPTALTNDGDADSPPLLQVNGPGTDPTVVVGGNNLVFSGLTLAAGQYVVIDTILRTIVDQTGASRYGALDFANTVWQGLRPGSTNVNVTYASGATGASTVQVSWRDAWV